MHQCGVWNLSWFIYYLRFSTKPLSYPILSYPCPMGSSLSVTTRSENRPKQSITSDLTRCEPVIFKPNGLYWCTAMKPKNTTKTINKGLTRRTTRKGIKPLSLALPSYKMSQVAPNPISAPSRKIGDLPAGWAKKWLPQQSQHLNCQTALVNWHPTGKDGGQRVPSVNNRLTLVSWQPAGKYGANRGGSDPIGLA